MTFSTWCGTSRSNFRPEPAGRTATPGFLVLGAVIEAVTGRDYFEHMRAVLFEPLGMQPHRGI
jgi:CubicO group peptidase (beta-lactamase class C family)